MVPQIDRDIGISVYSSSFAGTGGSIKNGHDDFKVSEVLYERAADGTSAKSGYAVYMMEKAGMDTAHALDRIRKKTGLHLKALGLKDAAARTRQYVCTTGRRRHHDGFSTKNLSLEFIGFAAKPLTGKDMAGNKFDMVVRGNTAPLYAFDDYSKILNFFGYQRFGSSRPLSHLVGRALVRADYKSAVDLLLSYSAIYESDERRKIRAELSDPANHHALIRTLPPGMDIEITLLHELVKHDDSRRAFFALPVRLRRFFVQAYQSYLFNLCLSSICDEDLEAHTGDVCYVNGRLGRYYDTGDLAVPLPGYAYRPDSRFDSQIKSVMESENLKHRDFYLKDMQEASLEGGFRTALIRCKNTHAQENTISFELPRGSFATIVLREIIKPAEPIASGF